MATKEKSIIDDVEFSFEPVEQRPDGLMDEAEMDHFKYTLKYNGSSMEGFYSMGVGHRDRKFADTGFHIHRMRKNGWKMERDLTTHGGGAWMVKPKGPDVKGVLWSLLMDSNDHIHGISFEDWCDSLGYDNDSIKALKIYEECQKASRDLFAMFGAAGIEELNTLLEDY